MESIQMPVKLRTAWVDYAKLIAICLVVMGHQPLHAGIIDFIFSFHMPVFFFLSGYLDKGDSLHESVGKGVRTLLVPYAVFYSATFVILLAYSIGHPDVFPGLPSSALKAWKGFLLGAGYNTGSFVSVNQPLWFLPCLFLVKCLHSTCRDLSRYGRAVPALGICLSVLFFFALKRNDVLSDLPLAPALLVYLFYFLGCRAKSINFNPGKKMWLAISGVSFVLTAILARYNGRANIALSSYGENLLLFYFAGISGSVMIVGVSHALEGTMDGIAALIAYGTVFILATHIWISRGVLDLLGNLGYAGDQWNLLVYGLSSLLILGICYPAIQYLGNRLPILVGRCGKPPAAVF